MSGPDAIAEVLRHTPRPYRMPGLPATAHAAARDGLHTAMAFALEAARAGRDERALFVDSLARLIRTAIAGAEGDPSFQALVLKTRSGDVRDYLALAPSFTSDRRRVRAAIDAVAHPGKGDVAGALARLRELEAASQWRELRSAIAMLDDAHRASLSAIESSEGFARLVRLDELLQHESVRAYQALVARQGPLAGSADAAVKGREAKRLGEAAERQTAEAFAHVASVFGMRLVRSLRVPVGFPGDAHKAKDEWDAAIVCGDEIVLLAEVKASPAAAAPDYSRLHRGLERFAHAVADERYTFAVERGEVTISGASLRQLLPQGRRPPPHVVYCCAGVEEEVDMLSAAAQAVLFAEPASIAFALELQEGKTPPLSSLDDVWRALPVEPRLRSALHQYETATIVRDAMIRPHDLAAIVLSSA